MVRRGGWRGQARFWRSGRYVVVGLLPGRGPGVEVGYVPGVFGVQRDGYAEQVLAQRREPLVQGKQRS